MNALDRIKSNYVNINFENVETGPFKSLPIDMIYTILLEIGRGTPRKLASLSQTCTFFNQICSEILIDKGMEYLLAFDAELALQSALSPIEKTLLLQNNKLVTKKNLHIKLLNFKTLFANPLTYNEIIATRLNFLILPIFPHLFQFNAISLAFNNEIEREPIEECQYKERLKNIKIILEYGVDVNCEKAKCTPPLMHLIYLLREDNGLSKINNLRCYELMECLFKSGASPRPIGNYFPFYELVGYISNFLDATPFSPFIKLFLKYGAVLDESSTETRSYRLSTPLKLICETMPTLLIDHEIVTLV